MGVGDFMATLRVPTSMEIMALRLILAAVQTTLEEAEQSTLSPRVWFSTVQFLQMERATPVAVALAVADPFGLT